MRFRDLWLDLFGSYIFVIRRADDETSQPMIMCSIENTSRINAQYSILTPSLGSRLRIPEMVEHAHLVSQNVSVHWAAATQRRLLKPRTIQSISREATCLDLAASDDPDE